LDHEVEEILPSRTADLKKKLSKETIAIGVLNTIEKEKFIIDLWIQSQPSQQVLIVNWREFLESTDELISLISQYLNVSLDEKAIKKQVKLNVA
jgi:hypothetical protein